MVLPILIAGGIGFLFLMYVMLTKSIYDDIYLLVVLLLVIGGFYYITKM